MILIVGLGNPGNKYKGTRHNLGFRVIDELCSGCNIKILFDERMCAYLGRGHINKKEIIVAKPQSFVNQSGTVVRSLIESSGIPIQSGLIVICDDIDLPVGGIRIREKGSSGGHRGLESIIRELGDSNFIRIRLGIGRPPSKKNAIEYVLSEFEKGEIELIAESMSKAIEAIGVIIDEGIAKAMSVYNQGA